MLLDGFIVGGDPTHGQLGADDPDWDASNGVPSAEHLEVIIGNHDKVLGCLVDKGFNPYQIRMTAPKYDLP